jgi:uncharacterized protein
MKITVSDIPDEGIDLELEERLSSETIKILSPVKAVLRLDKKGSEVIVRGVINGEVEQQCGRCLKTFGMDIRSQLDLTYRPAEELKRDEHHELKGEELETGFYGNDELDIDELLKEQMLLNIPMKPLCSAQCKGLCPKCGTDLNSAQCGCEVSVVDERLAVLKQLLKRKE